MRFENVTYNFYKNTLGRSIVPESDFNSLALTNKLEMSRLLPFVEEREENGIDSAVCFMIEVEYIDGKTQSGENALAVASESVGGHSVSFGTTAKNKLEELNAKSTQQKKIEKIKLFCDLKIGVM